MVPLIAGHLVGRALGDAGAEGGVGPWRACKPARVSLGAQFLVNGVLDGLRR